MGYPLLTGIFASTSETGTFDLLQTLTISSDSPSVSFNNISQEYRHLQIRLRASSSGTLNSPFYMQINGINTNNDWATLQSVNNTVTGTNNQQNGPAIYFGGTPGGTNLSYSLNSVIDIQDYNFYNKSKSIQISNAAVQGGTGSYITSYTSGLVYSLNPVTEIAFGLATGGGNIKANSKISLYGIK